MEPVTPETTPRVPATAPRSALIFLHGSGDTGRNLERSLRQSCPSFFQQLESAKVEILFPSAPLRPYSLAGGRPSSVWHDRTTLALDAAEDVDGLAAIHALLDTLVEGLGKRGVPPERIVLGGFSMGGGTALHFAYTSPLRSRWAGVFCASNFVTARSGLFPLLRSLAPSALGKSSKQGESPSSLAKGEESVPTQQSLAPLLVLHGTADRLVPSEWGEQTAHALTACGVSVELRLFTGVPHTLADAELKFLTRWAVERFGRTSPPPIKGAPVLI